MKGSYYGTWEKRYYIGSKPFYGLVTRGKKYKKSTILDIKPKIELYTLSIVVRYADTYLLDGYWKDLFFSSKSDRDNAYRQIIEWFNKINIKEGIEL